MDSGIIEPIVEAVEVVKVDETIKLDIDDNNKENINVNDDDDNLSTNTDINEEAEEMKQLNQKLKMCIEELGIKDNNEAIEKLVPFILCPDKITELITEEDIFNLFIEKFKKLI